MQQSINNEHIAPLGKLLAALRLEAMEGPLDAAHSMPIEVLGLSGRSFNFYLD